MRANFSNIHSELAFLTDNLVSAIKNEKAGSVKELLSVYRDLVETFVKKLKQLGADYDMVTAQKELSSFEQGWPEMRWLNDAIREMLDEVFRIKNYKILRDVIYFPLSVAHIALVEKDYYTYHEGLKWIPYMITCASKMTDEKVGKSIIDTISLHLRELADFYLGHLIKKEEAPEDIARLKELAGGLIRIFSQILKSAYDENDLDSFIKFNGRLSKLFQYTFDDAAEYILKRDEELLEQEISPEARQEREEKLSIDKALYKAGQYLNERRLELRYGLQSWVVKEYLSDEIPQDKAVSFYKELGGYGDIKKLTNIYFACSQREVESFFGWDWWGFRDTDGEVVVWGSDMGHSMLFCLKALEILQNVSSEQYDNYRIPENKAFIYKSEELLKILKEIDAARPKWEPLIGLQALDASPILSKLIQDSAERQKENELNTIIKADIDPEYSEQFKKNIIRGWKKNASMRNIIREFGVYKDIPEIAPENLPLMGYNIADRKDIYVKDSSIYNKDWGDHFGAGLADSESQLVAEGIFKSTTTLGRRSVIGKQLELIDEAIEALQASNYHPNIILLFNSWNIRMLMTNSEKYKRLDLANSHSLAVSGYYGDIPVCELNKRGERGILVVADLKRLGVWKQYEPRQLISGEERLEVFTFLLRKYDEAMAEDLLAKNQDWLKNPKTGLPRTHEEGVREILQRVHLRILEQYEYVVEDSNAGFKINMGKDW
ncbi:MAG: hypothetical protein HZA15_14955 [Nitrospirae bacterium]|nr:hypothetical protein [Nitrospirota bacterium]